ncbi:MAG: hypothetical protein KDB01_11330 [Planctomycetaceae bacterium]|mgnify:CR=1 FL=1|nr:hypothetical protein [Planctomycetaceae bacterium]
MRIALTLTFLWLTIAIEQTWSGSLPHGALLLPIACGVMFWMRSVSGILLASTALLLDWIARPGFLPLCPMLLPGMAACLISPSSKPDDYSSRRQSFVRMLTPLHVPLITLMAVSLQLIGQLNLSSVPTLNDIQLSVRPTLPALLMISLPVSAGISMLMRLADELGLRHASQQWI